MAWLAPNDGSPVVDVPVKPYGQNNPGVENGIFARGELLKRLQAARRIMDAY